jgi:hypothetical protein
LEFTVYQNDAWAVIKERIRPALVELESKIEYDLEDVSKILLRPSTRASMKDYLFVNPEDITQQFIDIYRNIQRGGNSFFFFRIRNPFLDEEKKDDDSHYDPGLPFTSRRIGVNVNRFPVEMSAMKIFFELFTHKLERNMIDATNCFEKKHYGSAWTPLSHMEFFAFLMVVMSCTWVLSGERDDYWGEGCFRDLFVTSVFPKQERFNQIFFTLHVRSDNS